MGLVAFRAVALYVTPAAGDASRSPGKSSSCVAVRIFDFNLRARRVLLSSDLTCDF
jgi:hypothetical protein